jgi:transcriptional regulator with XRE-family HTH domain
MADSFGTALAAAMEAADLTQVRFATKVGLNQGQLSRILAGKRRPPLNALPQWFDVLGLTKAKRDRLHLLAHLAHATPWLRTYVQALQRHAGDWSPDLSWEGRRPGRVAEDDGRSDG